MTLQPWLTATKQRGATITVRHGHPTTKPFLPTDRQPLARYHHALTVAAAGTHPTWWNHIARSGPIPEHFDAIPAVAYPDSEDGYAFACTTCGQPAPTLDTQLLAWCKQHDH